VQNSTNTAGSRFIFTAFTYLLFLHALAAYSFGPLPIQWVSQIGLVGLALWLLGRSRFHLFAGLTLVILLLIWAVFVTAARNLVEDFSAYLSIKATTGYWTYVGLRFLNLTVFVAAIIITTWLLRNNMGKKLVNRLSWMGVIIGFYAIYVYVAQLSGWPELPRTRVGTSGGEQSVKFTYAFHRAMGSFREPSHLAEWLLLPYFLSFGVSSWLIFRTTILASVILLTGSLTGIAGIVGGLAFSLILSFRQFKPAIRGISRSALPLVAALLIFSIVVVSKDKSFGGLGETLWARIEPLLSDKGLKASNRDYVYFYVDNKATPLIGEGLGNANIRFGWETKNEATTSFLSLYLNILFSLGVVGLLITIGILCYPLALHVLQNHFQCDRDFFYKIAAYGGWLIVFTTATEEFTVHFGVIYALVVDSVLRTRAQRRATHL
jgi:hypothetical protein